MVPCTVTMVYIRFLHERTIGVELFTILVNCVSGSVGHSPHCSHYTTFMHGHIKGIQTCQSFIRLVSHWLVVITRQNSSARFPAPVTRLSLLWAGDSVKIFVILFLPLLNEFRVDIISKYLFISGKTSEHLYLYASVICGRFLRVF